MDILKKASWPTILVMLVILFLVFQVDALNDLFVEKNRFFK